MTRREHTFSLMDATTGAKAAATLVVLRDAENGLQVLLTVRPRHLRFMGGATVFPGGAVAPADFDHRWRRASSGLRGKTADEEADLALRVCALREAFEEVGLLLGRGALDEIERDDAQDPARFLARCLEAGVVLATETLVPIGRWVTPLGAPVRFDAAFFLVAAPQNWEPTPDPSEVESCAWLTPSEALAELASGTRLMAPPTVEVLQLLERYDTVTDALEGAAQNPLRGPGRTQLTRLSPLVTWVLAPNAGVMTGPGTNTYVVGTGPVAVIDPAVDDDSYVNAVCTVAPRIDMILVTHRHSDHVGGVEALARRTGAQVLAFGSAPAGGVAPNPLHDGESVHIGGGRLQVLHAPGHSSDHLCFLLEHAASLFAGDNVLGEGTAVIAPPDGNMRAYLATLERLAQLEVDRIYPGHFRPLDGGRAVLQGYIDHRRARERKIAAALQHFGEADLDAIVRLAYDDTPAALHPIARYSALAHLEMMEEDGRAARHADRWVLTSVV